MEERNLERKHKGTGTNSIVFELPQKLKNSSLLTDNPIFPPDTQEYGMNVLLCGATKKGVLRMRTWNKVHMF